MVQEQLTVVTQSSSYPKSVFQEDAVQNPSGKRAAECAKNMSNGSLSFISKPSEPFSVSVSSYRCTLPVSSPLDLMGRSKTCSWLAKEA